MTEKRWRLGATAAAADNGKFFGREKAKRAKRRQSQHQPRTAACRLRIQRAYKAVGGGGTVLDEMDRSARSQHNLTRVRIFISSLIAFTFHSLEAYSIKS